MKQKKRMNSKIKNDLNKSSRKNTSRTINGFEVFECDDCVSISDASTKDTNKLKTQYDKKQ